MTPIDPSTVPGTVEIPLWLLCSMVAAFLAGNVLQWRANRADRKDLDAAHAAERKELHGLVREQTAAVTGLSQTINTLKLGGAK